MRIANFGYILNVIKPINKPTISQMEDDTAWYCIKCIKSNFPFNNIDNNQFHSTIQHIKIKLTTFAKKD